MCKKVVCVEYYDITYHDSCEKSDYDDLDCLHMKVYGQLYDDGKDSGFIKVLSEETVGQDGGNNAFYTIPVGCVYNYTEYTVDDGYTIKESRLRDALSPEAYSDFLNFMVGQTVSISDDGESEFYEWDFMKWLNHYGFKL